MQAEIFLNMVCIFPCKIDCSLMFTSLFFFSDGSVTLKNYEATAAGLIESNIDRFKSSDVENILLKLWENEIPYQEW